MIQKELNEVLRLHKIWLDNEKGGKRANLMHSDLSGADLGDANLGDALLIFADLSGTDLSDSDLSGAKLAFADLSNSNLRGANLINANLSGANLSSATTESAIMPMYCKWDCAVIDNMIMIGCKTKSIEDWDAFFASDEEYNTKRGTDDFLRIQAVYNAYKAYLQTFNTKEK